MNKAQRHYYLRRRSVPRSGLIGLWRTQSGLVDEVGISITPEQHVAALFPIFSSHSILKKSTNNYAIFSTGSDGFVTRKVLSFTSPVYGIANDCAIGKLLESSIYSAATYTGTWVDGDGESVYGGYYKRSLTAGDKAIYTTPAGTSDIGLRILTSDNAGIAKIVIDGDATIANGCSTAQERVTAGKLAATALVVD